MIRFCSVLKNLLFLLLIVSLVACRNERDSNRQEINSAPVTSDPSASDPSASDLVYSISNYEATFEVVANETEELKNLHATLLIRYNVAQGTKSDGFKFVGTLPVRDVHVVDDGGRALAFQIAHYNETKITWQFPAIDKGTKVVIVDFVIEDAVQQSAEGSEVQLEWVKNFRVPVETAIYRLVLPFARKPTHWQATPDGAKLREWHGRTAIEVVQSPIQKVPFTVSFNY